MKNVAGRSSAPRRSSRRGTPTRAPYSPRWSIAGVTRSYPNQTDSASKSNVRQTRLDGMTADRTGSRSSRGSSGDRVVASPGEEESEHEADHADDHQDQPNRLDVDPGDRRGHREVQDRSDG